MLRLAAKNAFLHHIQPFVFLRAYYQPTAFLSQEGNFPALYAMLNQLHKLRFKLFASDVQYFEADIISPVLARESSPVMYAQADLRKAAQFWPE